MMITSSHGCVDIRLQTCRNHDTPVIKTFIRSADNITFRIYKIKISAIVFQCAVHFPFRIPFFLGLTLVIEILTFG